MSTTLSKKSIRQEKQIIQNKDWDSVIELVEEQDLQYNPRSRAGTITGKEAINISICGGLKVEYHVNEVCFRAGGDNKLEQESLDKIYEALLETYDEDVVIRKNNYIDVRKLGLEEFEEYLRVIEDVMETTGVEIPNPYKTKRKNTSGVLFEGSNFSNAHERSTTIGTRFMKMLCKKAGMNVLNMDAEWGIKDAGRIDAVELDENEEFPISIVECQSGIQNGDYLDDEHLNKSLLRYPSDSGISPTLKKIVILAGGYTTESLETIKWHAYNLEVARGIEVILLQTTRVDNKIGVEVVNYKK